MSPAKASPPSTPSPPSPAAARPRTFTYQSDGKLDKTYLASNQELIDFNYDSPLK